MLKKLIIPRNEQAILDQFKADLPKILEGRDPFRPDPRKSNAIHSRELSAKDFETEKCSECKKYYVHTSGLCTYCMRKARKS